MRYLVFLLLFSLSGMGFSQEVFKLHLMNGKEMEIYQLNDSSFTTLTFLYDKNYFKRQRLDFREARRMGVKYQPGLSPKAESMPVVMKEGDFDREAVFSVSYPNGLDSVFYQYDPEGGNYLRVEEMRAFVAGEGDARMYRTGKGWFYSGLAVGLVAGLALETSVWTLAVPPLFSLTTKIPVVHIREAEITDPKYRFNENYAAGFESRTRSKNFIEALKGSALGTALGMVIYSVANK